jgi:hypothetical protein
LLRVNPDVFLHRMIQPQLNGVFKKNTSSKNHGVRNQSPGYLVWPLFCFLPFEYTMKKALLITSLLAAIALTACGKKEEAPVAAPAAPAAVEPAAPAADAAAAPAAPAAAPAADAAAAPATAPAADAVPAPKQ